MGVVGVSTNNDEAVGEKTMRAGWLNKHRIIYRPDYFTADIFNCTAFLRDIFKSIYFVHNT